METSSLEADGKVAGFKERIIWNGGSILQFDFEERRVFRFPIPEGWKAPPGLLRLPFFFQMTVDEAKRDYEWELVLEDQGRAILRITPRPKQPRSPDFRWMIVELDKMTFLPRQVRLAEAQGHDQQIFEAIDVKLNGAHALDGLEAPCLDAWKVLEVDKRLVRWFFR